LRNVLDPGTDSRVDTCRMTALENQRSTLRAGALSQAAGVSTDTLRHYERLVLTLSLALPVGACGQSATSCPMHKTQTASGDHSAGVDTRGDHAMGFSHEKSAHHFRLFPDGGEIDVIANEPDDNATRDEIRTHLSHIAEMFTDGNFEVPMFIHDTMPPGVLVKESKRTAISYLFEPTPAGGQVRIVTSDKDASGAIHHFLAFQIDDHKTGDSRAKVQLA